MRYFLLFLLLSCYRAAFAQVAAPIDSAVAVRPPSPVPDTAAAIHRLFAARRARSYLVTTVLVVPEIVAYSVDSNSLGTAVDPLAAAPYELANLICHRRYRKKAEERALLNFQSHQLSPRIEQRLKPKYFVAAPPLKHF